jgi:hypothetical protein
MAERGADMPIGKCQNHRRLGDRRGGDAARFPSLRPDGSVALVHRRRQTDRRVGSVRVQEP